MKVEVTIRVDDGRYMADSTKVAVTVSEKIPGGGFTSVDAALKIQEGIVQLTSEARQKALRILDAQQMLETAVADAVTA